MLHLMILQKMTIREGMTLLINCQKTKEYLKVGDRGIYVGSQITDTPEINYSMGNY